VDEEPEVGGAVTEVHQEVPGRLSGRKKWSRETVYAITSLTAIQASPAELAAIIRGHWMIEDRLHWAT
jgi:predicted transposase YbfD/YdcC